MDITSDMFTSFYIKFTSQGKTNAKVVGVVRVILREKNISVIYFEMHPKLP